MKSRKEQFEEAVAVEEAAARLLETLVDTYCVEAVERQRPGCGHDLLLTTKVGDMLETFRVEVKADDACYDRYGNLFIECAQNLRHAGRYTEEMVPSGLFLNDSDLYFVRFAPDRFALFNTCDIIDYIEHGDFKLINVTEGNIPGKRCVGYLLPRFLTSKKKLNLGSPLIKLVVLFFIDGNLVLPEELLC